MAVLKIITTASGLFTCLVWLTFDFDLIHVNHLLKIITIIIVLLFVIITIRNLATFFTIYLTNSNLVVKLWMSWQKLWILHYHSDYKRLIPVDCSSNHVIRGVCSVSVAENTFCVNSEGFPHQNKANLGSKARHTIYTIKHMWDGCKCEFFLRHLLMTAGINASFIIKSLVEHINQRH